MILIGPGALLLLVLLAFRPVRFVVGWALFLLVCFFAYACTVHPSATIAASPIAAAPTPIAQTPPSPRVRSMSWHQAECDAQPTVECARR
jgi:uncharacterized SAM-binding protein YcdF (DUF218 family)